jgi:hypothetical protein
MDLQQPSCDNKGKVMKAEKRKHGGHMDEAILGLI